MTGTTTAQSPLALITGASTGIGLSLAREFAHHGYDLVVTADEPRIADVAAELEAARHAVVSVETDLTDPGGVEELYARISELGRPVAAAALNAGVGCSGHFHQTPLEGDLRVVDLNVRSVVHLTKLLLPGMVDEGSGRLLFTASIAGLAPGPYHATYSASKAFVHLFAEGIRHELRGTGVTVTSLMPGPTDTAFFDRAEMRDTRIGQMPKDDPDKVAAEAFRAMVSGADHVVSGSILNKLSAMSYGLLPDRIKAFGQGFLTKPRGDDR